VDEKDFYYRYIAVVAAISADRGVDAIMTFDQAVKTESFIEFLEKLQKQNRGRTLNIFMDNLQVHKGVGVKQAMDEWKMKAIWNVPYRFDFMPIELVFS